MSRMYCTPYLHTVYTLRRSKQWEHKERQLSLSLSLPPWRYYDIFQPRLFHLEPPTDDRPLEARSMALFRAAI